MSGCWIDSGAWSRVRLRQSFPHAHNDQGEEDLRAAPVARATAQRGAATVPGLVTAQALAGDGLQVWLRPEGGGQRFALVGVDQFAPAEFPRRVQTVADIGLTGLTVALHPS